MKVSTENDNNFGHEQITILVDNIPLRPFEISHNLYLYGNQIISKHFLCCFFKSDICDQIIGYLSSAKRNRNETKRNQRKRNEAKRNQQKRNETKRNQRNENETNESKTKSTKTKRNRLI